MSIGIDGNMWYVSNGLPLYDDNSQFAFDRTLRKAIERYNRDFEGGKVVPKKMEAYADQTPEEYKLQERSHL